LSPRDPAHEVLELQRRHAARSRERVLSDNELRLFWQATANMAPAYRDALRLVLLTGQRPGEVIGIRAEEVDSVKAVWRIPAARVKNKRDHSATIWSRSPARRCTS